MNSHEIPRSIPLRDAGVTFAIGVGLPENLDSFRSEMEVIDPEERARVLDVVDSMIPELASAYSKHVPDALERLHQVRNGLLFINHSIANTLFLSQEDFRGKKQALASHFTPVTDSADYNDATMRFPMIPFSGTLLLKCIPLEERVRYDTPVDLTIVHFMDDKSLPVRFRRSFLVKAFITNHEVAHGIINGRLGLWQKNRRVRHEFHTVKETVCDTVALRSVMHWAANTPTMAEPHDIVLDFLDHISDKRRLEHIKTLISLTENPQSGQENVDLIRELVSTGTVSKGRRTKARKILAQFQPSK